MIELGAERRSIASYATERQARGIPKITNFSIQDISSDYSANESPELRQIVGTHPGAST